MLMCGGVTARRLSRTPLLQGLTQKLQPKIVMITALHDKPCKYPNGDYLNLISVLNKQVNPQGPSGLTIA
jgi:hypothetical protein